MKKRWTVKPKGDIKLIQQLSLELNINTILANLLIQRGIDTFDKAHAFFRPRLDNCYDPFLMMDMDKAVDRLIRAIDNNEKILIYGDYDVDGTAAVALLYSFLIERYENIDFYIPERYGEGYGISYKGVDFAKENNFSLVISVDCGIKAFEQIDYANTLGIDFIVCDHHLQGEKVPNAYAILDPKRNGCNYPYKELSGCGVGFKFLHAYCIRKDIPFSEIEKYLDLVAISIASDIVPITDENRVLTYYGLEMLNHSPRVGIKAILDMLGIKKKITVSDIVFSLAPRLNAAGRINTGRTAVQLLIAKDINEANNLAKTVNTDNSQRKDLDAQITQEALEQIQNNKLLKRFKSTVVYDPRWHKGVLGIVASRLTDIYYRPTIVLTESDGLISGSARSIKGFDLYNALDQCSDLLEHFGGHKYAAGLAIKSQNLHAFIDRFEKIVSETVDDSMLIPEIEIDAEIDISDITTKFYNILKQFAPFGPDNMKPVFLARGVSDSGYAKVVGTNHLRMNLISERSFPKSFEAIAFQQSEHYSLVTQRLPFDVCFTIEENEWNGQTTLQMNVKDIKRSQETTMDY